MFDFTSIQFHQDLLAILMAVGVGGLIGIERQSRDKAAGLRTMIFICLGATFFTIISRRLAPNDPVRVAAQVVSGIGFLGAGVIMRNGPRILGVTTAAVIWMAAALGMGIGAGYFSLVLTTTLLVVVVLWFFRTVTRLIDGVREEHAYTVGVTAPFDARYFDAMLAACHLECHSRSFERDGKMVSCTMYVAGPAKAHQKLVESLLNDPKVESLHY